jgi:hypothetical protein
MKPERKLPGVWCQHCNIGKGCGIYEERPESCRVFECLWLQDKRGKLGDDLRPDRCKVMFAPNPDGKTLIAFVDPATPTMWRKPNVLAVLRNVARENHRPCFAWAGARCWAIMPDGSDQIVPESAITRYADGGVSIDMRSDYELLPPTVRR